MSAYERVLALQSHYHDLTIKAACERLGVSEAAFYAARTRRRNGVKPRRPIVIAGRYVPKTRLRKKRGLQKA